MANPTTNDIAVWRDIYGDEHRSRYLWPLSGNRARVQPLDGGDPFTIKASRIVRTDGRHEEEYVL